MSACSEVRLRHARRLLVGVLGAAVVAGAALPPALTGVHRARADVAALPEAGGPAAPALVASAPGQLDLFYPATNGSLVYAHRSGTSSGWGGAENLGGRVVGGAAAAAPTAGSLAVAVRGADNRLYLNRRAAGRWSGWASMGGVLSARPGVAATGGRLDVFARGSDGELYTKSQVGGREGDWMSLGGLLATDSGPAASALGDGRVAVVVRGVNGALYQKSRTVGGSWTAWYSLAGQLLDDPAATSPATGALSVFVRGVNSHLYAKTYAGAWSGWSDLGGLLGAGPAAAAAPGSGRTDVVVQGPDGRLFHRTYAGSWSGWAAITPPSLVKPALGGLMTRGIPSSVERPYLGGFAVVADWREVEPARGRYDFSFIDARVGSARSFGMGVRLRINAGTQAPDWAKAIGGAPVPTYDHQRKVSTIIGRFWTPSYQAAWRELMATLAARYDANPTVREVNVSGTGVLSSEVMLLMATDKLPSTGRTNGSYWLAAGYTESQRQAALAGDIEFMASVWRQSRLDLCLHPMQMLDASGRVTSSVPVAMAVWDRARAAHRNLHAFHTGYGMPIITGQKAEPRAMYDALLARRAPFDVQTLNMDAGLGDPNVVLPWAASHGMLSLELPGGKAWEGWNKTLLLTTNAQLKANAVAVR